jgi:hypothetical protein
MFWFFIFIVWSIGGFFFMQDYCVNCVLANKMPFGDSMIKLGLSSLFLGGITTFIFVISLIAAIWESINNICKK